MTTAMLDRTRAESRWAAMGTDVHVLVDAAAPKALLPLAVERLEMLEHAWSRFRADSALNHLNALAGAGPVFVGEDLLTLVERMRDAWISTDGLFDPTVLASIRAHGYDADFAEVASRDAVDLLDVQLASAPGMSGVVVDAADGTVSLPAGLGLDPGAIGKGLAADIVADELLTAGATAVLVNLGGDIALRGTPAEGEWAIAVDDERLPREQADRTHTIITLDTDRAGIATSTTLKRRWAQGRRHHVIDPRTGGMSTSPLVQATIIAGTACDAEVRATSALLQLPDAAVSSLRRDALDYLLFDAQRVWTSLEGAPRG